MSKRFKVMVISAIIALAFTLPLAAQTNTISDPTTVSTLQGVADPTSNQRSATATLYKTDVDNYLNVNNWSGVKFDKWFGFLHGSTPYLGNDYRFRANLGYATNVGGIYLATRYWGNIFQETEDNNYRSSVTLTPTYDEDTQTLISLTETTAYPNKWRNSTNHIDVLIGVAGQGIRVGFYESMAFKAADGNHTRSLTKTDYQDGRIVYANEVDEYAQFGGHLRPSLQWGTQLSVSNLTIKPRAGAAFNIYQDTLVDNYANYDTVNGKLVGQKTLNRANGYDNGYLQPVFAAGADIGLPKKDTLATTVTIDYLMNLNIYNNDYSASGFSGTAKGPVGWGGGV